MRNCVMGATPIVPNISRREEKTTKFVTGVKRLNPSPATKKMHVKMLSAEVISSFQHADIMDSDFIMG